MLEKLIPFKLSEILEFLTGILSLLERIKLTWPLIILLALLVFWIWMTTLRLACGMYGHGLVNAN